MNTKRTIKIGCFSLIAIFILVILIGNIAKVVNSVSPNAQEAKNHAILANNMTMLNRSMPQSLGNIGSLNQLRLHNDTISADIEVAKEVSEELVKDNYMEIGSLIRYAFARTDLGLKLSDMAAKNNLVIECVVSNSSKILSQWTYTAKSFTNFSDSIDVPLEELMKGLLKTQVILSNAETPVIYGNDGMTLEMDKGEIMEHNSDSEILKNIALKENEVIFTFSSPETDYSVPQMKIGIKNPNNVKNILSTLCKDRQFKEYINLITLAKCNMIFRYDGVNSMQSVDIVFPNEMLEECKHIY